MLSSFYFKEKEIMTVLMKNIFYLTTNTNLTKRIGIHVRVRVIRDP